jgi:hypothetical protein
MPDQHLVRIAAKVPGEPILPLTAHSTNGSNAQIARFAKFGYYATRTAKITPELDLCNTAQRC